MRGQTKRARYSAVRLVGRRRRPTPTPTTIAALEDALRPGLLDGETLYKRAVRIATAAYALGHLTAQIKSEDIQSFSWSRWKRVYEVAVNEPDIGALDLHRYRDEVHWRTYTEPCARVSDDGVSFHPSAGDRTYASGAVYLASLSIDMEATVRWYKQPPHTCLLYALDRVIDLQELHPVLAGQWAGVAMRCLLYPHTNVTSENRDWARPCVRIASAQVTAGERVLRSHDPHGQDRAHDLAARWLGFYVRSPAQAEVQARQAQVADPAASPDDPDVTLVLRHVTDALALREMAPRIFATRGAPLQRWARIHPRWSLPLLATFFFRVCPRWSGLPEKTIGALDEYIDAPPDAPAPTTWCGLADTPLAHALWMTHQGHPPWPLSRSHWLRADYYNYECARPGDAPRWVRGFYAALDRVARHPLATPDMHVLRSLVP